MVLQLSATEKFTSRGLRVSKGSSLSKSCLLVQAIWILHQKYSKDLRHFGAQHIWLSGVDVSWYCTLHCLSCKRFVHILSTTFLRVAETCKTLFTVCNRALLFASSFSHQQVSSLISCSILVDVIVVTDITCSVCVVFAGNLQPEVILALSPTV